MAGYTDVCFAGRLLVGCIAFAALGFVTANARSDEVGQLTRQIEAFKTAGKYDDAIIAAERRAKLVEKRSGSSSAQTASALQEWSDLLAGENRHTEALPIVRRVLAIREQALGNHRDT